MATHLSLVAAFVLRVSASSAKNTFFSPPQPVLKLGKNRAGVIRHDLMGFFFSCTPFWLEYKGIPIFISSSVRETSYRFSSPGRMGKNVQGDGAIGCLFYLWKRNGETFAQQHCLKGIVLDNLY